MSQKRIEESREKRREVGSQNIQRKKNKYVGVLRRLLHLVKTRTKDVESLIDTIATLMSQPRRSLRISDKTKSKVRSSKLSSLDVGDTSPSEPEAESGEDTSPSEPDTEAKQDSTDYDGDEGCMDSVDSDAQDQEPDRSQSPGPEFLRPESPVPELLVEPETVKVDVEATPAFHRKLTRKVLKFWRRMDDHPDAESVSTDVSFDDDVSAGAKSLRMSTPDTETTLKLLDDNTQDSTKPLELTSDSPEDPMIPLDLAGENTQDHIIPLNLSGDNTQGHNPMRTLDALDDNTQDHDSMGPSELASNSLEEHMSPPELHSKNKQDSMRPMELRHGNTKDHVRPQQLQDTNTQDYERPLEFPSHHPQDSVRPQPKKAVSKPYNIRHSYRRLRREASSSGNTQTKPHKALISKAKDIRVSSKLSPISTEGEEDEENVLSFSNVAHSTPTRMRCLQDDSSSESTETEFRVVTTVAEIHAPPRKRPTVDTEQSTLHSTGHRKRSSTEEEYTHNSEIDHERDQIEDQSKSSAADTNEDNTGFNLINMEKTDVPDNNLRTLDDAEEMRDANTRREIGSFRVINIDDTSVNEETLERPQQSIEAMETGDDREFIGNQINEEEYDSRSDHNRIDRDNFEIEPVPENQELRPTSVSQEFGESPDSTRSLHPQSDTTSNANSRHRYSKSPSQKDNESRKRLSTISPVFEIKRIKLQQKPKSNSDILWERFLQISSNRIDKGTNTVGLCECGSTSTKYDDVESSNDKSQNKHEENNLNKNDTNMSERHHNSNGSNENNRSSQLDVNESNANIWSIDQILRPANVISSQQDSNNQTTNFGLVDQSVRASNNSPPSHDTNARITSVGSIEQDLQHQNVGSSDHNVNEQPGYIVSGHDAPNECGIDIGSNQQEHLVHDGSHESSDRNSQERNANTANQNRSENPETNQNQQDQSEQNLNISFVGRQIIINVYCGPKCNLRK